MNPSRFQRFKPTEEEIITHYLDKKLENNAEKVPQIHDVDICSKEPWQLSEQYSRAVNPNDDLWYFYHPISSSSNMKRTTKDGSWKVTGKKSEIYSNGQIVGTKIILVYHEGHGSSAQRTPWVIHEYQSKKIPSPNKKAYVVCRLTKN